MKWTLLSDWSFWAFQLNTQSLGLEGSQECQVPQYKRTPQGFQNYLAWEEGENTTNEPFMVEQISMGSRERVCKVHHGAPFTDSLGEKLAVPKGHGLRWSSDISPWQLLESGHKSPQRNLIPYTVISLPDAVIGGLNKELVACVFDWGSHSDQCLNAKASPLMASSPTYLLSTDPD